MNGLVSRDEMHDYALNHMQIVPDNTLDRYFDEMDKNGDGQLDKQGMNLEIYHNVI